MITNNMIEGIAYTNGWDAYTSKVWRDLNPYPEGMLRRAWFRGYDMARGVMAVL